MIRSFLHTLKNGLRVVCVEMPHLHAAELAIYLKVGGRNDPPGREGLSHFLEHILGIGIRHDRFALPGTNHSENLLSLVFGQRRLWVFFELRQCPQSTADTGEALVLLAPLAKLLEHRHHLRGGSRPAHPTARRASLSTHRTRDRQ